MDLFYTISPHLATGKKKMWGLSQKIHKGSLAFFGKWDKINKIRTKPGMRREYGSPRSVCVPASQEQAFYKSCCAGPDRADRGVRSYGWHEGLCRPLWIWFIHFILHTKVRKEARFMTKIDIVSGFLGAGKTTLIKKMLAEAYKGEKLVLIENEFGEISIDGGFLKDAGVQISEMSSGCICCSLVGDFGRALVDVQKKFSPDRILIEPSGVGKLSDVILAVENTVKDVPEMKLNSFVTVADASKVKVYMKNFGEFYNNQIETAGTIILSRTQKVSPEKLQASVALLREKNQDAAIITTPWDELDGKTILAAMEKVSLADELMERIRAEHEAEEEEHHHHHHDHDHEEHDEHEHHHDHDDHDEDEEHEHHHHHDDECCHDHEHDHEHHHDHDHEEHEHHHHHDGECDDPECSCHHHHHHADEVFTSWGAETPKTFTQADIDRILAALDGGAYGAILRAKGIVPCENGKWLHFDYVPEEHEVRFGPADYTGRLCVIGSKLDEGKLKELFGL